MDMNGGGINDFLLELYRQTEGDVEKQVSMHDVGISIGMEKDVAGALAEDLMIDEHLELKSLSGGVAITQKGIDVLQHAGLIQSAAPSKYTLSGEAVLTTEDQTTINELLQQVQLALSQATVDYTNLEELVIDMKTIEVQLLSPQPKAGIVKEIFQSLQQALGKMQLPDLAGKLEQLCS